MDDEIDEDNDIVGHKSVTRKTDSNRKCFWKEINESQDDDDEVIRSYIDVFEQDDITTMKHGCILDSGASASAGAGLFWKRWVRVRRDSTIKNLLKIFLFIFLIYC